MLLSTGRFDISRAAALADAHRFRFDGREDAGRYCDALPLRIENAFDQAVHRLDAPWQATLHARLRQNLSLLRASK